MNKNPQKRYREIREDCRTVAVIRFIFVFPYAWRAEKTFQKMKAETQGLLRFFDYILQNR